MNILVSISNPLLSKTCKSHIYLLFPILFINKMGNLHCSTSLSLISTFLGSPNVLMFIFQNSPSWASIKHRSDSSIHHFHHAMLPYPMTTLLLPISHQVPIDVTHSNETPKMLIQSFSMIPSKVPHLSQRGLTSAQL